MRSATKEHLSQFHVFSRIPEKLMHELADYAFFRKYKKGQSLFMEGDPRDRIYFSLSGYSKLTNTTEEGVSTPSAFIKPYSMFPYVGLFNDSYYRSSAETVTEVELLYIATEQLERILQRNTTALTNLVRIISGRLHNHKRRLQKVTHTHASQRVHQLLSFLIDDLGEKTGDVIVIPCPITMQDLADMAGTSRETIGHVLREYVKEEKVDLTSKILTIKDPEFFRF
ncbi:Crp/Fnr family transcriptional regulator [Aneurinibacillus sp. BA2021]|nr:Crp/Fnr family transcriptional regulator [Aneurinibacillus sp. BA2021]